MDEGREDVQDWIRSRVWSGYYDPDEVFDIIEAEVSESDDEDETWLRGAIQREFRKKRRAERAWPRITDCDRLDRVFETLHGQGILAQHRCGYTQQDGLEVVDGLYEEAGGQRSAFVGYCLYILQDMEAALWGDVGLWLAFGSFSRSSEHGIEVGRIIREEAERAGFQVVWDGTIASRPLLKGFRWQRRSPVAGRGAAADRGDR